ncbi:PSD1 and planctomycete cytochrome C domain-containing protein [Schlesneria paludicola]|uniref:PSD1 and planctomycete cytochrome C domain-containing protein n=1 Tax=Schlesneria paludicola TaxID=360056 RepID=UPI00029AFBEE|nr:PSD1 and planctomycete cytochrome C domain-containing protein [Schlesneria paludicola]
MRFGSLIVIVVSVLVLPCASWADVEVSTEEIRFFETSIRPLLVDKCHKCHGADKQWGSLRLDSRETILTGGDSGPAIAPGAPGESLLIRAVSHTDDNVKMPPKEKLTDQQIADLTRWVSMGAPYPASAAAKGKYRDPNHWSFQPLQRPAVPLTQNSTWGRGSLDQFILNRLERENLVPAERADKRTLIRRATFDLTGLPPTPDEVEAFLQDDRPDADERLFDRLLAAPAYGERWGRHWLDVARYADSNGLDENIAHGNAWRYRDYVISSFNEDRSFDQFLLEQLSGDLLTATTDADRHRMLVATGFLAIGPKVLAEVDESKMRMDIIDEQIDAVGRAFLGLTLGCARCHDHKFDPILTADYYGLAGIFKSTRTMDQYTKIAQWHENPTPTPEILAQKAVHDADVAKKKETLQSFTEKADGLVKASLTPEQAVPEKLEDRYPDATKSELKLLRDELAAFEKLAPVIPSAMGVTEDAIVDVAIHIRGNPQKLGDVVSRRVPDVVAGVTPPQFAATSSGRLELARWLVNPEHPLTSRVLVNRLWRWHFGKGLVRTPDNFGMLGEQASHPDLLDWLARETMRQGWSLKALHRQILGSSVYQLDSRANHDLIEHDPENRLFGRANIKRLEAEAIRDSLIAIGGGLDRTLGGSLLKVKNREFFFDHTSKDLTDYHSRRRSVYQPIVRNNVYDVLLLLDYPDAAVPSGDRVTTTIAPQALLMMNSDLVASSSTEFARDLLAEPASDDSARVIRAYEIALGRVPSRDEITESLQFVGRISDAVRQAAGAPEQHRQVAWESLCHVILNSNEFVYIK